MLTRQIDVSGFLEMTLMPSGLHFAVLGCLGLGKFQGASDLLTALYSLASSYALLE